MPYRILYHPAVREKDLSTLGQDLQGRIRRAIEQRLATEPTYYGEPLRHHLKGYWKLRVGDYRIIYRLVGSEVWVLTIGHRREVYTVPSTRLSWRPSVP